MWERLIFFKGWRGERGRFWKRHETWNWELDGSLRVPPQLNSHPTTWKQRQMRPQCIPAIQPVNRIVSMCSPGFPSPKPDGYTLSTSHLSNGFCAHAESLKNVSLCLSIQTI